MKEGTVSVKGVYERENQDVGYLTITCSCCSDEAVDFDAAVPASAGVVYSLFF